ncbi:Uncharacterised protein [Vibrio cholerae]|nr:Uncharacterised protein [Vibrio cholerae]
MPWNQPFKNSRINIAVMLPVAHGIKPKQNITSAERSRPALRK